MPSATAAHALPLGTLETRNLNVFYGEKQVLFDISMHMPPRLVTAIIGPSGCGKSTFLKTLNRILEEDAQIKVQGQVLLDGEDVYQTAHEVVDLRRRVGMVFQHPNLFPATIWETVAFGPRLHGLRKKADLDRVVEESLNMAALWNEVKDRLNDSATALSGGQQQRLCIARALSVYPEVLLMDEPCAALDPTATAQVEETIRHLRHSLGIVLVTHNMHQAMRCSQQTAFFLNGYLMESGETEQVFQNPQKEETNDYICGRFG